MSKEEKLDNKINELKECQTKNNLNSCTNCDLFLKCDLRKDYVLSAYQSMNEDMKQGGFDFN